MQPANNPKILDKSRQRHGRRWWHPEMYLCVYICARLLRLLNHYLYIYTNFLSQKKRKLLQTTIYILMFTSPFSL
jgi:hypothetical protein